jgi:isoleucyl-tRNA synthetase
VKTLYEPTDDVEWINVDDPDDMLCIGSIDELEQLSGVRVDDLHKHIVDQVVIERDGQVYRRTPEVLDCWFESGAMPYAQQHYPFERSGEEDAFFPAHFIAEGLDQTRGWFYTLLILGTCLFGRSPFRNVVVNGMILAEDGSKMSKRKKNYPDPNDVLHRYGADALRAYLIDSPVVRGEKLQFSEKGLSEIVRTVVLPYWNALAFFSTYAEIDRFHPGEWAGAPAAQRSDDDRWILSVLQRLVRDVNAEMEAYRLYTVVPRLVGFIDDLTTLYIRTARPRFWRSEDRADQSQAFHTLYQVLVTFARVLAPFMPFITETVYQKLVRPVDTAAPQSVHWCDYPQVEAELIDAELERRTATVRAVVGLGPKLREEHKLKLRQPLAAITVVHRDPAVRADAEAAAAKIGDELKVKLVATEPDESVYVSVSCKPNFQTLRTRCGPKLGAIGKALKAWSFEQVARLEAGETIEIEGEAIGIDDVLLQRQAVGEAVVATDGHLTVGLDPRVTPELEREGIANEFKSRLQAARKDAGLQVTDRIAVIWQTPSDKARQALQEHAQTIAAEVLATAFAEGEPAAAMDADLNGEPVVFALAKSQS